MVKNNSPLQIRLTEPVIFLRGPSTGTDFRGRPQTVVRDGQPAIVRGLLTLRLNKPTRIRNISISLEGKSRTEWPEGIGPRRTDTFEEHEIIAETTTFFSATDKSRRSHSVGPGLAAYDLDSEGEFDADAHDLPERGRGPRSSSVIPTQSGDWRALSRTVSPEGMSRQGSAISLSNLRLDRMERDRGPSPAYTPFDTPPLLPRHTGLREVTMSEGPDSGAPSRQGSHLALADLSEGVEWQPEAPSGNPEEVLPLPAVADPGPPTSTAIRFRSPVRRDEHEEVLESPIAQGSSVTASPALMACSSPSILASPAPVPPGAPLAALHSRAESMRTIDSTASTQSSHSHTEYHPVTAGHKTAVTTPVNETPPAASPQCGSPLPSGRSSFYDDADPRRSSGLRAAQTPPSGHSPNASAMASPRSSTDVHRGRAPGSIVVNGSGRGSAGGSEPPSSTNSNFGDERGRRNQQHQHAAHHNHHHKFSLAAAIRGLSQDVKERVRSSGSRPGSRASSRSRGTGTETPRTPHFHLPDSAPGSAPMSRDSSANNMPVRGAVDESFASRGHRSRSHDTKRTQSPARHDDSRGRSRHRMFEEEETHHNWKEFRKGVYNYPISFPIPLNAPPTIHAEFGSVQYKLKATVVRVGALTPNLVEEVEINMVAGPQEDDMEETDNVIVERQWEEQMRYQIALSGKAFPIGGVIPMSIRLMPLTKCKIHRLTVALEEKTDYYAVGRKVARHETPRRFILFAAKNADMPKKERGEPLLPILSDSASAIKDSPLAELARNAALNNPREFADYSNPEDDVYASLLDPLGPWHLEKDLVVPDCNTRIKFTTKHEQTNIAVGHWLKVTLRVERGDDQAVDSKGRRKQFDIIIETPIKILDCRVNPQYNSLPSYERLGADATPLHAGCAVHAKTGGAQVLPKTALIGAGLAAHSVIDAVSTPLTHPFKDHTSANAGLHHINHAHDDDTLLERNIVYDRLMSGQETETGELPPSYGEAVAHAIRSARTASRATSTVPSGPSSRAGSRAPSRPSSRSNSRAPGARPRMYIED